MIPEELWRRVPGESSDGAGAVHQDPRYLAMSTAFLPPYDPVTSLPDGLESFRCALPRDWEDEQAYYDRVRREYPELAKTVLRDRQNWICGTTNSRDWGG